jgi:hypothetical protein
LCEAYVSATPAPSSSFPYYTTTNIFAKLVRQRLPIFSADIVRSFLYISDAFDAPLPLPRVPYFK